jgi:hypothetical protein
MRTVRGIFSKAYGEIPKEATCHIGWEHKLPEPSLVVHRVIVPVIDHACSCDSRKKQFSTRWSYGGWSENCATGVFPIGPDISDRDAEAFRGLFDDKYDQALDCEEQTA